MSRVITVMGGLEVALDYLQAHEGAYLHAPSSSMQPTVSQRALLPWLLPDTGAALHWALHSRFHLGCAGLAG